MCGLYPGQNMRRTQRRIRYERTREDFGRDKRLKGKSE